MILGVSLCHFWPLQKRVVDVNNWPISINQFFSWNNREMNPKFLRVRKHVSKWILNWSMCWNLNILSTTIEYRFFSVYSNSLYKIGITTNKISHPLYTSMKKKRSALFSTNECQITPTKVEKKKCPLFRVDWLCAFVFCQHCAIVFFLSSCFFLNT